MMLRYRLLTGQKRIIPTIFVHNSLSGEGCSPVLGLNRAEMREKLSTDMSQIKRAVANITDDGHVQEGI